MSAIASSNAKVICIRRKIAARSGFKVQAVLKEFTEELNQLFKFLYVNQTWVPDSVSVISLTDYNNIFSWSNSLMVKLEVSEDVTLVLELIWHIQTSVIYIFDWLLRKQGFSQPAWRMDVNDSVSYINTWLPICSSTAVILDQMRNTEEASLSCSVPHVEVALNSRGNQLRSFPMGHTVCCITEMDSPVHFHNLLSCTVLTGPARNDADAHLQNLHMYLVIQRTASRRYP